MEIRNVEDRRTGNPFGTKAPWLTKGVMGGMVFTDRRKATDRRVVNTQIRDDVNLISLNSNSSSS